MGKTLEYLLLAKALSDEVKRKQGGRRPLMVFVVLHPYHRADLEAKIREIFPKDYTVLNFDVVLMKEVTYDYAKKATLVVVDEADAFMEE